MPTYKNMTTKALYIDSKIVEPFGIIPTYQSLDDDSRFKKISDEPFLIEDIPLEPDGVHLSTNGVSDPYVLTLINHINSLINSSTFLANAVVRLRVVTKNHVADINAFDDLLDIQRDEDGKIISIGLLSTINGIAQQIDSLTNQLALETQYREQEDAILQSKIE